MLKKRIQAVADLSRQAEPQRLMAVAAAPVALLATALLAIPVPASTQTVDPPGQVIGVTVTPIWRGLFVKWTEVPGATGYKVQWKSGAETFSDAAAEGREHQVSGGDTVKYTIPRLTADTQYTVRVIASKTDADDGPPSAEATGTPLSDAYDLTFGFAPAETFVNEGDTARITLRLTASRLPADAIVYRVFTVDGTAISPADFVAVERDLEAPRSEFTRLPDGDYRYERVFELTTLKDMVAEENETFSFDVLFFDDPSLDEYDLYGLEESARITIRGSLSAPMLDTAVVNRATLVLTYGGALDEGSAPADNAYTVRVNGIDVDLAAIDPVAVRGSAVTLTLASAVAATDSVTVSYEPPTSDPIRNPVGNQAEAFTNENVTNTTPPAQVMGVVVIPLDRSLRVSWTEVPGATGYKVQWKSGAKTFSEAANNGRERHLSGGNTATYTIPSLKAGTQYAVRVIATRNEVDDGPHSAEVNGTPLAARAPMLNTAVVTGTELVLTYDEALDETSVPADTAYTVNVGGSPVELAAGDPVVVEGSAVTLTLASAVAAADTVTVSYEVPSSSPLQDLAGTDAAALNNEAVTNAGQLAQVQGVSTTRLYQGILVKWTAVPGATGYKVQWRGWWQTFDDAAGAGRELQVSGGDTVKASIFSLWESAGYRVRVIAVRPGLDDGPPSAEVAGSASIDILQLTRSLAPAETSVREGDSARITLQLTASRLPPESITFRVSTEAGTASSPADYVAVERDLEAPRWEFTRQPDGDYLYERTFELTTLEDLATEENETFFFNVTRISDTSGQTIETHVAGDPDGAVITIRENVRAPMLDTAEIAGDELVLTYDEALDESSVPSKNAYSVRVNGSDVGLADRNPVVIRSSTVTLTLASAVALTDTVKVSYAVPSSSPVQDLEENDAAAFTDQAVTNVRVPTVVSATVNGTELVIAFSENLAAAGSLANEAFTVKRTPSGGTEETLALSRRTPPSIRADEVTLTLASAVTSKDTVTVGYAAPVTDNNNRLEGTDGNEVRAFADQAVTNVTATTVVSATVNGTELVIAFSENLAAADSLTNETFTVKRTPSGGVEATFALSNGTPPSIRADRVALTLASAVSASDTVTVSYAVPSTEGNNRLEGANGNEVRAFTNLAVANTTAPGRVTGVSVTPQDRSLRVNWTAVPGATGYRVQWKSGQQEFFEGGITGNLTSTSPRESILNGGERTTYTIERLQAGVEYTLRVIAARWGVGADDGPPSAEVTGTPLAAQAPLLKTMVVNGAELVLRYGEALDDSSVPTDTAYTVRVNGSAVPLANENPVAIRSTAVMLTLASAVAAGDTVTVSYAVPTSNPVRDLIGNGAGAFSNRAVTNGTGDVTAPRLVSATVNRAELVIAFSEDLAPAALLANTAFKVMRTTSGGVRKTVALSDTPPSIFGDEVTLTLASAVAPTDTVTVSYAVPTSDPLQDLVGNDAAAFNNRAVTNETPPARVTGVSVIPLDGALRADWTTVQGATGYKVQWRSGSQAFSDASGDGRERQVAGGDTVTDTIPSLTAGTQYTVRVIATRTSVDDGRPSGEVSGTPLASRGPMLDTAVVNGAALVLTYDEALDESSVPSKNAYTVRVNGSGVELAAADPVAVRGSAVTLTLASAVTPADTATISYAVPASNPVQDLVGAGAAAFTDRAVTITTVPTLVSAVVSVPRLYAELVITFNRDLAAADSLTNDAFTVSKTLPGGDEETLALSDHEPPWISGNTVTLTLAMVESRVQVGNVINFSLRPPVTAADALTVCYARPETDSNNRLKGEDGAEVADATCSSVTNTLPPDRVRGVSINPLDGGSLRVNWTRVPGATGYKVQWRSGEDTFDDAAGDGRERRVSGGVTVTDTIPSLTAGTQYTVRVIATKHNTDDGPPSKGVSGTPVASVPPVLESAVVNGAALVLTYDEDLDEDSVPANTAYTVNVDGSDVALADADPVAVRGRTVTLTLASAVSAGETVTVSYAVTSSAPVQDPLGADAAAFTDQAVTNTSRAAQVTGVSVTGFYLGLLVEWTAVPGATGYKVQWRVRGQHFNDAADDGRERQVSGGDTVQAAILPLSGGALYGVRVIAVKTDVDDGPPSAEAVGRPLTDILQLTKSFAPAETSVREGDTANITFQLRASRLPADALVYRAVTQDGTARSPADYERVLLSSKEASRSEFTLQSDGDYLYEQAFELTTLEDMETEENETFYFNVTSLFDIFGDTIQTHVAGDPNGAIITIRDGARAPMLDTAVVTGVALVLTYDEALDEGSVPADTAYTVSVDGTDVDLANTDPVTVEGSTVTLTLASAVSAGDTVTVSYSVPTSNPVQDLIGTDAAAFTDEAVTNVTADTTAPTVVSATVNGASLVIAFSEDLAAAGSLANESFTVRRTPLGGVEATFALSAGTPPLIRGDEVTLTLASAVSAGDTVTVSYAVPATNNNNRLEDANGNDAVAFTNEAVTNATPPAQVTGVVVTPLDGSVRVSWTEVSGATGYKVQWRSGAETFSDAADDGRERDVSGGSTVTDTVPSLTAGTLYTLRVIATRTDVDDGPPSAEVSGTPLAVQAPMLERRW